MQKITPNLWFDGNAKEAVEFYVSVFDDGKITSTSYYPIEGLLDFQQPLAGKELTIGFELSGHDFVAINAGPEFKFNPSISFFIHCETTEEVDSLWEKLSVGGKVLMPLDKYPFSERYGWVQDRYGLGWQIMKTNPGGDQRPKIMPSIMFIHKNAGKAEAAMDFYLSVFKDSKKGNVFPYEPADNLPEPPGNVAYEDFELLGVWFAAMDSSSREHNFDLNEAISFSVACEDQNEIDYYWEKLSAVKESEQCGWLKDKYGVSWQIVPKNIDELISGPSGSSNPKAFQAMMNMKKIDVAALKSASF